MNGVADAGDPPLYFDRHIFVCTNRRAEGHPRGCCAEKKSEPLRAYLKARVGEADLGRVRVNASGCLDRCELGPVLIVYPEGVWYTYRSAEDLDEIIQTHLVEGRRVTRLMLRPEDGPKPPAID
ncbi:MAG: (2Fe-2S) ferredoxin domain-containing protein [Alphaproteobacteria bacterium]|nr:(2Fe-2S) ferredoxin domain-containing protein [Alphaproteobacteria bacterium]MDX5368951.1 (2Fe-2S) ferredoxin domain-containing protein [Alphaproteobacteria bacterium]